jgi:hypothetical protein
MSPLASSEAYMLIIVMVFMDFETDCEALSQRQIILKARERSKRHLTSAADGRRCHVIDILE